MVEPYRWVPDYDPLEPDPRRKQGARDPAEPGGPGDIIAGWDRDHWDVPRDFGAHAKWAGTTGARDSWVEPEGERPTWGPHGPRNVVPEAPPLGLRDRDQFVGGRPYSGLARRAEAKANGPKGFRRSDERIREDVCEALIAAVHLDVGDVSVDVENGKVKLGGTVPERRMKHAIEDVAAATRGVDEVENRVRLARADFAEGTSGV
jgi:hypothetical protein